MSVGTLLEYSVETYHNETLSHALKSIGEMDIKTIRSESWFDDLHESEHGPVYEIHIDESWLEDIDEAA